MLTPNDIFKIEAFMQKEFIPNWINGVINDPELFKTLGIELTVPETTIKDDTPAKLKIGEFRNRLKHFLNAFDREICQKRVELWQEQDKKTSIKIVGN